VIQTACNYGIYEVPYTAAEWAKLTSDQQYQACLVKGVFVKPLPGVKLANAGPRSQGLAIAGLLVSIAGVGAVLNFGEDTKNVLGSQYCVSDYGDVAYGACGSPMQTKVGLIMIGSGTAMMAIGLHKVNVSPMIGPNVKGAKATIRWGGKR
jgi:hypothetical protein